MSHEIQRIDEGSRTSWLPLIIVMLCQVQISVDAFTVSIQGVVEDEEGSASGTRPTSR